MDSGLLSDAYATPWFIALVDELVDTLHQNYPDANWTHLPPATSTVSVANPQVLYARAACSTSFAQSNSVNGNSNSNASGNGSNSGSGNSANSSTDSSDSNKSGGNNTVLIAAVAGAVGGCLFLAGIIFFFYRRHVKRKHAASPPAPTVNPTLLDSTPMASGKAQPLQFQGGPMAMETPPSTYVPSSSGDSSSNYNYAAPLSPQWTGMTGAASTHLGHPPPSLHPSSYYTISSRPHSTTVPTPVSSPPPWAVPMDPHSQANLQHPQAFMSMPNFALAPSPSPSTEKAQFSGYAVPVHHNQLPAWAVDHKRPEVAPGPSNSAGPSGSGTGEAPSNVLEQPGDALPPPAYTVTPSSL